MRIALTLLGLDLFSLEVTTEPPADHTGPQGDALSVGFTMPLEDQ